MHPLTLPCLIILLNYQFEVLVTNSVRKAHSDPESLLQCQPSNELCFTPDSCYSIPGVPQEELCLIFGIKLFLQLIFLVIFETQEPAYCIHLLVLSTLRHLPL